MGRKGSQAWGLAVVLGLVGPPLAAPPERRETVGGAYARSVDALELVNRDANHARVNRGAWGQMNSARDQARQAETPVQLGTPPFSPWSRW